MVLRKGAVHGCTITSIQMLTSFICQVKVFLLHNLCHHLVIFNAFTCIGLGYCTKRQTCNLKQRLTQSQLLLEERHFQQRGAGRVIRGTQACSLASCCPGPSDFARPTTYKHNYNRYMHSCICICQSISFPMYCKTR